MDFKNLKVGYSPNSLSLKAPGDRRRFVFYAQEKKMVFELADPTKKYDIIYVTAVSNLSLWMNYKRNNPATKLVFEIIDSYLLEDIGISGYLRGLSRYITGREKRLYLNFQNAFISIIKIADAVVCSTPIQQQNIARYNKNVHVSLDYFSNDITHHKTKVAVGKKLKLVWEGQAYTVKNLLELNEVFKALTDKIELQIITDPEIKYPFKIFDKKTADVLKPLGCSYILHPWQQSTFSKIIAECDLAIIPMDMRNKLILNKPENKLLLLWEIGIPVLTSATPAYKRVMDNAGLDYYCNTPQEWMNKLQSFINKTPQQHFSDIEIANNYLGNTHRKEQIIFNWDQIFLSAI